jgi:hypothetical protein
MQQAQGVSHVLADLEEIAYSMRRERGGIHPDPMTEPGLALQTPLDRKVFRADKVIFFEFGRTDE